ncbi:2'-5' RNA ligase family protein [Piscinibacter gummiphilus]|uniref:2'-5' RNA ligase family protein n=1 Tax=Piscinibacter gummiphilus TaxID=946333 RepID=A0ABZ0CMH7_9BURK|nr:2'-5' RNA ligase family protein [Piscinibacter gummiphilus]WOB06202.1 2'-5' RNA ligase family protein [Piscinibacter gummiphilus]
MGQPERAPRDTVIARFNAVSECMAEHPLSPSTEPPRRPTDRLFFALLPDAPAAAAIAELANRLKAEHGLKGRPLATSRFHVTLHFFGDHVGLPHALVDGLAAAASALRFAPFDVVFDQAVSFPGRPRKRPFVLRGSEAGLAALMDFRRGLSEALVRQGLGELVDDTFTPHVTLLYDGQLLPPQPVGPIVWRVNDFALVDSLIGQARHVPLARWPLQGASTPS